MEPWVCEVIDKASYGCVRVRFGVSNAGSKVWVGVGEACGVGVNTELM